LALCVEKYVRGDRVKWHGRGRRGENPRKMKTQERIGSSHMGKTKRMEAQILTWLKPLKMSPS
jgi:hypothetical protein